MASFNDLTRLLESFTKNGPSGCSCALAKDGKTIYEGYFGLSDIGTNKPMTEDTLYRMYSMTKPIICAAALILFERGKFLLDDPYYEYFPEYKHLSRVNINAHGVTDIVPVQNTLLVKHAFSMSCGLPYPWFNTYTSKVLKQTQEELKQQYGKYNLQTEVKAVSKVPIAFEPGTRWAYGYGHELVAALIEAVSGMTVGEFLKKEIFEPLGMENTGYRFKSAEEFNERMASMYLRADDGALTKINASFDEFHMPDALYEAGGVGLYSNLRDYLKFTQMMANGGELGGVKILGRKTIDLMRQNQLNDLQINDLRASMPYLSGYGYGLGVRTMLDPALGNSNGSIGEFGWTGGMGTYTCIDPSEGFSLVYMHQLRPNMEQYHHHRVRAAAYGCI